MFKARTAISLVLIVSVVLASGLDYWPSYVLGKSDLSRLRAEQNDLESEMFSRQYKRILGNTKGRIIGCNSDGAPLCASCKSPSMPHKSTCECFIPEFLKFNMNN
ncbi:uncharacterized protein [Penaeus vannamei]|uniref:uncharacterized protein n=1 Tax=Penaeus vannamei TaxID=6689 RepID=UPI00387F5587